MLCGDEINSAVLSEKLVGEFIVDEPDSIGRQADEWGAIIVSPLSKEYILDDGASLLDDYERWFPDFLEANEHVITTCGINDIRLFMEIFYIERDQFNFEILGREHIMRLGRFKVALSISIYTLTEQQMIDWIKELRNQ